MAALEQWRLRETMELITGGVHGNRAMHEWRVAALCGVVLMVLCHHAQRRTIGQKLQVLYLIKQIAVFDFLCGASFPIGWLSAYVLRPKGA